MKRMLSDVPKALNEEIMVNDLVAIPDGITRIAPMRLDSNCRGWREKESRNLSEGFPLYQYEHIGTLVIPPSIDIPHDERYSPFASYEQRSFIWNYPTKWKKIHIAKIENHSPHLVVEDGVLYSADKSRQFTAMSQKYFLKFPVL